VPHGGGGPGVRGQYGSLGAGPAALALPPRLQRAAVPDPVDLSGAADRRGERLVPTPLGARDRGPLGRGWSGGLPAGAPGQHPDGTIGMAGHLLEPRGGRWGPDPIADAPPPRSPRRPGPHA